MKFTPLLITASIILGLLSVMIMTDTLYGLAITRKEVKLETGKLKDGNSNYRIVSKDNHVIDTIFIDSAYYESLGDKDEKVAFMSQLKDINNRAFMNLNPEVFRWVLFQIVTVSLSFSASVFILFMVIGLLKRFRKKFRLLSYLTVLFNIIIVVVLLFFISKPQQVLLNGAEVMAFFHIIFSDPEKVLQLIVLPMYLISIIPAIGILIVNVAVYHSFQEKPEEGSLEENAGIFAILKDNLNIFALYTALLVSCAVIGTGLMRDMMISQFKEIQVLFPKEMIYAYGISFSIILALLFIPTYAYLRYAGKKYHEVKVDDNQQFWSIGVDTIDNIKIALSVALPVLSSIIQPLFSSL